MAEDTIVSGFFAGASLGYSMHTIGASGYEDESGSTAAFGVNAGYNFNDNVSFIVDYTNYGSADLFSAPVVGGNVQFFSETTGLSGMVQYISERVVSEWSYGARLGLIAWSTDVSVKGFGNTAPVGDDSGVSVVGGFMARYAATEKLDLIFSADWFVYDHKAELLDDQKVDFQHDRYAIGLQYHF
uniref:Outer membrane protein OmpA-like transmembrane domain-containing protein n=1 Tax=Rheinheimera sp. BAL341 TaxID=1708203 RepID=A0A486XM23_9GAMM